MCVRTGVGGGGGVEGGRCLLSLETSRPHDGDVCCLRTASAHQGCSYGLRI